MTFDDIISEITEFPGFDTGVMKSYILDALKDICKETWAWTEVITFLTTAGTYNYTLTPSETNSIIIGIPHDGVHKATVNTPVLTLDDSTDTGTLTPTTSYSYRVTAYVDDYGETLPCVVTSKACPATGAIDLSWSSIDGADGYYIYGNNGSGTTYTRMEDTTSVSYTDDGTDTPDGSTIPPTESYLMKAIDIQNIATMKAGDRTWRQIEGDSIDYLIWDGKSAVRISQVPITNNIGFQVKVALKPTGVITVPSVLERYEDTIRKYVRGMMFMAKPQTEDNPWYNPKIGQFWLSEYYKDRLELKSHVMFGFGGELKVQYRQFAR